MRLRCPSCKAVHSIEAWVDEDFVVQALTTVAKMPREVAPLALRYVALFRPTGRRGLPWQKAARVLKELYELVTARTVCWERQEIEITPAIWARAIEIVLDAGIHPPLKNHNYLRHVAFEQAKKAQARAEFEREWRQSYPYHRPHDDSGPEPIGDILDIDAQRGYTATERVEAREVLKSLPAEQREELLEKARRHPTARFLPIEIVAYNIYKHGESDAANTN